MLGKLTFWRHEAPAWGNSFTSFFLHMHLRKPEERSTETTEETIVSPENGKISLSSKYILAHIKIRIYKYIYVFHSQMEPRTATQCSSLFINSYFISSLFPWFSIETGSTVSSKGQSCADHRVIDQSMNYLYGSFKCPHHPQIWSGFLGATMGRNSCSVSSTEVSPAAWNSA